MQNLPANLLKELAPAKITTSFVVGSSGEIAGEDGSSKGLGNQTDLQLLRTLRANSEVVLTSGLTARSEGYRMPRTADLAVLTEQGVDELNLVPGPDQKLHLLGPPGVRSYQQSLQALKAQYQRIHVEFGPRGARELRDEIDLFVVSGLSKAGIEIFLKSLDLSALRQFRSDELLITLAVGRG